MSEKPHSNLFTKVVHGGIWVVAMRIVVQFVSFVRYIVLANMLDLTDRGLLGVALLMMSAIGMFTATGFNEALIRKKDDIRGYLNTTWTIGIGRSVFICLLMYFSAPYMAMIKIPPEKVALAIGIIRAMGVTLVIGSLGNAGMGYFRKELDFKKLFLMDTMATLIDVTVVVVIASVYRTAWSMVFGRLASTAFRVVGTYILHPYRPRIAFDLAKARELWQFGKWRFWDSILSFLLMEGDDFFVWAYLGISDLTIYQLSYRFARMPITEISHVIIRVTYPAYSKLQDDIPRFRAAYLKVLEFTAFLALPAAALVFALAGDFVRLFLKEDLRGVIPVLQLLALRSIIYSVSSTRGAIFLARGKPRQLVIVKIVKLILLVPIIYPLTRMWGVAGTAFSILLVDALIQPMVMSLTHKLLDSNFSEMSRPLVFPMLATLAMLVFVTAFRYWVWSDVSYVCFFATAILAGLFYLGISYLFEKFFGYNIRKILLEQIATVRR